MWKVRSIFWKWSKKKINIKIKANYNISPNSQVIVLNNDLQPEFMKWGFSPSWSKNKVNIINARSETLQQKSDFKNSYDVYL